MPKITDSQIGLRLRQARHAVGLTQLKVCMLMDWDSSVMNNIEHGRRAVRVTELDRFCELYGVSYQWVIDGAKQTAQLAGTTTDAERMMFP